MYKIIESTFSVSIFVSTTIYAESRGARIINCSFGGSPFTDTEQYQIKWLGDKGILVVCAAGNGGDDLRGDNNDIDPQYPASYDGENIISVAAVQQRGRLTYWSNFGIQNVDIAGFEAGHHQPGTIRTQGIVVSARDAGPGLL